MSTNSDQVQTNSCTQSGCLDVECSAVFITPTRLLTANHCITGGGDITQGATPVSVDINAFGTTTPYSTEAGKPLSSVRVPIKGFTVNINHPLNVANGDATRDFAILDVDTSMGTEAWREVLRLNIMRPSLQAPGGGTTIFGAGYGQLQDVLQNIDGFSPCSNLGDCEPPFNRTVGTFVASQTNGLWTAGGNPHLAHGDSGSPLFQLRGDGSRDVFAIASFIDSNGNSFWADLTESTNAQWLKSTLVDADSNHSLEWRQTHPYPAGHTDRWFGETDYTGECQKALDQDCDGWFDQNDNCPLDFNPTQEDNKHPGIGDACPCPCDDGNQRQDVDDDGFCAVACPTPAHPNEAPQITDNCPNVTNKDQSNCNYDAEIAHGLPVYGDACDPVPCPMSSATAIVGSIQGLHGGNPEIGGFVDGRQIRNRVDTAGIRSQQFDCTYTQVNGDYYTGCNHIELTGVDTSFRFCQHNPTDPNIPSDCFALANIADHFASDPDVNTNPWHQITIAADPRGQDYSIDYNQLSPPSGGAVMTTARTWDYLTDKTYWLNQTPTARIPPPFDYTTCTNTAYGGDGSDPNSAVTCLSGRLWSHADNLTLGDTDGSENGITVGTHGAQLANNYFPDILGAGLVDGHHNYIGGTPTAFYRPDATYSFNYTGLGIWHFIFLWKTLPDPWEPIESLGHVSGVLVADGSGGNLGILQYDGTNALMPVGTGPIVDPTLQAELVSSSYVWASNVDPSAAVSTISNGVEGVALSADGTTAPDIALNVAGVLETRSEAGFPDFVTRSDGTHPQARTGFTAFYSGAAGGVFMFGGVDATSNAPLHDIWYRGMVNDWWLVADYTFDTLLAATYGYGDRKLYVLDHSIIYDANGIGTDTARLARIDLDAGTVESLGSWPFTPVYTQYALVSDVDGSVLLVASNASSSVIGRVAVDSSGAAYATVIDANEAGNLAFAPVVDPGGYAVTSIDPTSHAPTTRRYSELPFGAEGTYALNVFFPEPITNGGFESGTLAGWTGTGKSETISSASSHSGTYSARLGASIPNGDSTITQAFVVPHSGATLKLWYSNICSGILSYDWFTASIVGSNSNVLATIVPQTCASSSGWTEATLDLSSWAGQTVTVVMTNHATSPCAVCKYSQPSYTYVDDISVN